MWDWSKRLNGNKFRLDRHNLLPLSVLAENDLKTRLADNSLTNEVSTIDHLLLFEFSNFFIGFKTDDFPIMFDRVVPN